MQLKFYNNSLLFCRQNCLKVDDESVLLAVFFLLSYMDNVFYEMIGKMLMENGFLSEREYADYVKLINSDNSKNNGGTKNAR